MEWLWNKKSPFIVERECDLKEVQEDIECNWGFYSIKHYYQVQGPALKKMLNEDGEIKEKYNYVKAAFTNKENPIVKTERKWMVQKDIDKAPKPVKQD